MIVLIKRGYKMKTEVLELKFEGPNDIELDTLSQSLNYLVTAISKIADKSLREDDYCKFRVKNIEKGSFVITIEQIFDIASALFPYMPSILESLASIIELRKILGGKNPEKIEKLGSENTVIATGGASINIDSRTYNIYTTEPAIEKSLANCSKVISDDSERVGFSIKTKSDRGSRNITMDHDDLLRTSKILDVESFNDDVEEQQTSCTLIVRKPDLLGDSKWQFRFVDRNIYAEVKDEDFLEKVRNKEINFPLVSKLNVDMIIRMANGNVLNYIVEKVKSYE